MPNVTHVSQIIITEIQIAHKTCRIARLIYPLKEWQQNNIQNIHSKSRNKLHEFQHPEDNALMSRP